MAPTIHCVRHAQGFHNLSVANHSMHDPLLTPFGEQQCHNLQKEFPYHSDVDLIVASPLKRTIDTALLSFSQDIAERNLQVIALPELQETSDLPCDTGSSHAELVKTFESKPVSLDLVRDGWNNKRGRWAPTKEAIDGRAKDARRWLAARPEQDIVVVTHGGFLHYFTEDFAAMDRFLGTGWENTEYRSYTFDTHDPENPHLIETSASKQRRAPKPLDREEKTNLEQVATEKAASAAAIQAKWKLRQREGIGGWA